MDLDVFTLSRIQFAANITFHILFPSITIGLAWVLLFFKMRFHLTGRHQWMDAYFFWTRIFALSFAFGVVSGITMSFQFGTNWPGFMKTVGNVAGPLLAYEVLTAFFLEATFLGVMLFGFRRVPGWAHTLATFFVAVGTSLSAFWILALNSWMQTPDGFTMIAGKAHAVDWLRIVFNPSSGYRMIHTMVASGLTAAFLVAGISAYQLLRDKMHQPANLCLRVGVYLAAVLIPLQIVMGDLHGLNTLKHQPAKVAAMEALWETREGAPLVLFALPDEKNRTNHFSLEIPYGASAILTHDPLGKVQGLNDFKGNHPPVAPVFWGFRIMVGVGVLMLVLSWAATVCLFCWGVLPVIHLWALHIMTFSGWVATLAGWYVTEIGRQPWLVYNVLRTRDAVADIPRPFVGGSLVLYLSVYTLLLVTYLTGVYFRVCTF